MWWGVGRSVCGERGGGRQPIEHGTQSGGRFDRRVRRGFTVEVAEGRRSARARVDVLPCNLREYDTSRGGAAGAAEETHSRLVIRVLSATVGVGAARNVASDD